MPRPKMLSELILQNKYKITFTRKVIQRSYVSVLLNQIHLFYFLLRLAIQVNSVEIYFSLKPTMFSTLLLPLLNKKYNIFLEGEIENNFLKLFKNKFLRKILVIIVRFLLKNASSVVCAYKSSLNYASKYNSNSRRSAIGLNSAFIIHDEKRLNQYQNKLYDIIYVGSFREVHELDLLLELVRTLSLKCLLVGQGSEFERLSHLINKDPLLMDVKVMGSVEQVKVPELIKSAKVSWCYTTPEHWGVPIKVFESLALDTPVISSFREDIAFVEELNYGAIVRSKELGKLIEAYEHVAQIGKISSRSFILEHCNWKHWFDDN